MKQFFVSYTKADRAWAAWIAGQLEEAGYAVEFDVWDWRPGDNFILKMDQAAATAERTLVVLSPHYLAALYTQPEWSAAFARDPKSEAGTVLPVRVEPCAPKGFLGTLLHIDLVDLDEAEAKAALLAGVKRGRAKTETPWPGAHPASTSDRIASELPRFPRTPSPSPRALPSPWNVPHPRNVFYTGRENVLVELREKLTRSGRVAVTGLPGVGKTQSSVEYLYRHSGEYQAVFWVRAETRDVLFLDTGAIGRLLDLPESDERDQNIVVSAVQRWLQESAGWILVLDNLEDLTLATEFLPTGGQGHVLITTGLAATRRIAPEKVEIREMSAEEGASLLLRRAGYFPAAGALDQADIEDRQAALAIAAEVGGLPLALDHAGAFIEESSSPAEYLALYGPQLREQAVRVPFELVFQKVRGVNQAAADLLWLCAFLAPDSIPEAILEQGGPELSQELSAAAADPLARTRAIQDACRFSLMRRDPDARTLTIHRLVQATLRDLLEPTNQHVWAERALRSVARTFPGIEFANWPLCGQLLPHVQVCVLHLDRWAMKLPEGARLLSGAGSYLRERCRFTEAELLLQRAVALAAESAGLEHPTYARCLNELAILYIRRGRHEEAVALFRRVLSLYEKALGPTHPDVAKSLNNLATLCHELGRLDEAEGLHRRALAIREQEYGPEHLEVAQSLYNLAMCLHDQGNYAEVETCYERALQIRQKSLPPEHPQLAQTLNGLANLYWEQGLAEKAEPLYEGAREIWSKTLGPRHPNVAAVLYNLGALQSDQGRDAEAEDHFLQALGIWEETLGEDHPDLVSALNGLGSLFTRRERYDEAERLLLRALAIRETAQQTEHPELAETLNGLGELRTRQGRYVEAEPLLQRALAICEAATGPEHPQTATCHERLAELRAATGDLTSARVQWRRALAIREVALGSNHPLTQRTRERIASLDAAQP